MEHYDFAKVWSDKAGMRLYCTDSAEADALIAQLKTIFPVMKIHEASKFPSGEIWFHHVKELASQDGMATWWIIKQLCSRGWEPIGAASYVYAESTSTNLHYQFKRRSAG